MLAYAADELLEEEYIHIPIGYHNQIMSLSAQS